MRAAIILSAFAALSVALPSSHVVHEERAKGSKWIKRSRVAPEATLPVRIGLTQRNLDKGYEYIMDVSDPASPNYGKHWTPEQVVDAFAPAAETVAAVREWLTSNNIAFDRIVHSKNKEWFAFDATSREIEQLLYSQLHQYELQHGDDRYTAIASDAYHVPKAISHHIDYITPGTRMSAPLKKRVVNKDKRGRGNPATMPLPVPISEVVGDGVAKCDKVITPACIRALYQVPLPDYTKPEANNSMGIYETGDYYAQEDLNLFFAKFTKIPKGTHPILDSVDGGKAPVPDNRAGIESSIDFQLAYPLIYPQTTTLYQVDDKYYASLNSGDSHTGQFNTWFDALDSSYCGHDTPIDPKYPDPRPGGYKGKVQCGVYKPTNVISISYGVQEDDLPSNYQHRQCNEFMKLGLQGTSIFVASGDTGVAGVAGDVKGNGRGCLGPHDNIFNPTEPNSCPYVTNVGGTEVARGKTVHDPEVAVSMPKYDYYSTGGFSNLFPIPSYQKAAVATYFKDHKPPYASYARFGNTNYTGLPGRYNRLGRGIPDVAANGLNIAIFNRGRPVLGLGTSASSPIFAAIVNRLVEARLRAGKSRLGFINPALYANPGMLNDITSGSNPGCGTQGFKAVQGWDPVTGLGTPNYPKMLEYFMSLP